MVATRFSVNKFVILPGKFKLLEGGGDWKTSEQKKRIVQEYSILSITIFQKHIINQRRSEGNVLTRISVSGFYLLNCIPCILIELVGVFSGELGSGESWGRSSPWSCSSPSILIDTIHYLNHRFNHKFRI